MQNDNEKKKKENPCETFGGHLPASLRRFSPFDETKRLPREWIRLTLRAI